MKIISNAQGFPEIHWKETVQSAIPTGIPATGHNLSKMRSVIAGELGIYFLEQGLLKVQHIDIDQYINYEGQLYIVLSQKIEGQLLQNFLSNPDIPRQLLSSVLSSIEILFHLVDSQQLSAELNPNHILIVQNGLLVLPKSWSDYLGEYESEASREEGKGRINNTTSQASLQKKHLYALATILYRLACDCWPVESEDPLFRNRLKRMDVHRPIETILPNLDSGLSNWFRDAFAMKSIAVLDFLKYRSNFIESVEQKYKEPQKAIGSAGMPAFIAWQRAVKRERFRRSLIQRAIPVIALVTSTLAVLLVTISIIFGATRDLQITGLEPIEVVEKFYQSYNNLDHAFMDEASHRGVARSRINQIASIYVIQTVREGTERVKSYISAPEWFALSAEDQDKLEGFLVFGITDLLIVPLENSSNSEELRYRVEFLLWQPDESGLFSDRIEEIITLRTFRRGWKIVGID